MCARALDSNGASNAAQHVSHQIFQERCGAEDTPNPALLSLFSVPSSAVYFSDGLAIHLH